MSTEAVVVLLAAIGIVVGLILLVAAWRRSPRGTVDPNASPSVALGMSVGMLFGAALGTVVWISTGQFVFWVIFIGGGMTVGLAIGQARAGGGR